MSSRPMETASATSEMGRREREPRRTDVAVPRWLLWSVAVGWRVAFLAVLAVGVAYALSRLWLVVMPVFAALLIAAVLEPVVRAVERRGLPPLAATWLVLLVVGLVLGAAVWGFGPRVAEELSALPEAVDEALDDGRSWLTQGPLDISEADLDRWIEQAEDALSDNRRQLIGGLLSYAVVALHLIAGTLMTIVLAFFFIKDGPRMVDWVLEQLPDDRRDRMSEIGRRSWSTVSGYVLGSALNGLVEATLKAIGLLVLGVPLVLPLALLTFFGGFLPFVGAILAGAVAALVALATEGPVTALLVVALSVAIQNIEGDLLQPLIMGKVVKLHPVVVLVVIATAGILLGLPGAFLAVPVAATAANVIGYLREQADTG